MRAHVLIRITERSYKRLLIERRETFERVERVNLSDRRGRREQLFQQRDRGFVLLFEQQPGGGVSMPAIRVIEGRDELVDVRAAEFRHRWLLETIRHQPVNPSAIVSAVEVEELLDVRRNRPRMLD